MCVGLSVLLLAGCGRFGFAAVPGADDASQDADAQVADAEVDADADADSDMDADTGRDADALLDAMDASMDAEAGDAASDADSDAAVDAADAAVDADASCTLGPWGALRRVDEINDPLEDDLEPALFDSNRTLMWRSGDRIMTARRADGETTWGTPIEVPSLAQTEFIDLTATDDGSLVFGSGPSGEIYQTVLDVDHYDPAVLAFANADFLDEGPFVTGSGRVLYYSSRIVAGRDDYEVVRTERSSTAVPFTPGVVLANIGDPDAIDGWPTVVKSELEIVFERGDSSSGPFLRSAQRTSVRDDFGPSVAVGPFVSGSTREEDPEISTGGHELYFSASSGDGRGKELWVVTRDCL